MSNFPKTMFHAKHAKQVVNTTAQEKDLGSDWSETPIQQIDKDNHIGGVHSPSHLDNVNRGNLNNPNVDPRNSNFDRDNNQNPDARNSNFDRDNNPNPDARNSNFDRDNNPNVDPRNPNFVDPRLPNADPNNPLNHPVTINDPSNPNNPLLQTPGNNKNHPGTPGDLYHT